MAQAQDSFALRARYVMPVDGPVLPGGCVTICGERIVAVGDSLAASPPQDVGDVAIVPGLVNAHTHLEFQDLQSPLGRPGIALPDWIRLLMEFRASRDADHTAKNIAGGLDDSLSAGTTTLGEIATRDSADEAIASPVDVTLFRELIGLSDARVKSCRDLAKAHCEQASSGFLPGLSPHAPYTVRLDMLRDAARLSDRHRVPVAMHVAESPEELQLLRSGTGPFRDLLEQLGAWDARALEGGSRPLDYLRVLSDAHRALVIHGNYLSLEEIQFLGTQARRMSIVYCPRTHSHFRHKPYPLSGLLSAGVPVALGTDSRASNPDLSMLGEIQHVAQHHPEIDGQQALRMGTLAGAAALGLDASIGTLTAGKLADLVVIRLGSTQSDPHEAIMDPHSRVVQVWKRGKLVS